MTNGEKIFEWVKVNKDTEEDVHDKLTTLKGEYVRDWEDEFEDIHEAYEEQGRGEAENQLFRELIKDAMEDLALTMDDVSLDEKNVACQLMSDHYSIDYEY